jgi:hypothetical protein
LRGVAAHKPQVTRSWPGGCTALQLPGLVIGDCDKMSENATENGLTAKQFKALEAFALGSSSADAARAAGVNRSTVYRWQATPAFAAELRRLEGETLRHLGRRIMALADQAADAIEAALAADQLPGVRLRAAQLVCERGPSLAELTSILERIEELEGGKDDED